MHLIVSTKNLKDSRKPCEIFTCTNTGLPTETSVCASEDLTGDFFIPTVVEEKTTRLFDNFYINSNVQVVNF